MEREGGGRWPFYPMLGAVHVHNCFWSISLLLCVGFIAVDLTVACMTEVMWMFVLLDNSLLEMVFDYTLKFILDPVCI